MTKWMTEKFINKHFYAPFVVEKDIDYYTNLEIRYSELIKDAELQNADGITLEIMKHYTNEVLNAIQHYYHGDIICFHQIIKDLIEGCLENSLAVSSFYDSYAFPGERETEIQLFRGRKCKSTMPYKASEMLYLPQSLRSKSDTHRFSIPGVPCLYLGNTSYVCWLELGELSDELFVVSPIVIDNTLKILNLAVMIRDFHALNEFEDERVKCWLKLLILMIATSYRIEESDRKFKSEYIVSQSIMLACKDFGIDGIAYYSKKVKDDLFSQAAINVALFVKYEDSSNKAEIDKHIKISDSLSLQMFKQIEWKDAYSYKLRCLKTGMNNVIGNYEKYDNYINSDFCKFDQYLFSQWKDKDEVGFGI